MTDFSATDATKSLPPVGRFAPSPSGPLHLGSLVAALGSWLNARAQGGRWLLRIEDLDPPREQAGATDLIKRQLAAFGLHWDGEIMLQSQRHAAYDHALQFLRAADVLYACDCSRQRLRDMDTYDGHCRMRNLPLTGHVAWRLRASECATPYDDLVRGNCRFRSAELDDFIVRRRDGLYAYQLAVVVDDKEQGVTEVVRGADLMEATPRQMRVWQLLGGKLPRYAHLPLVINSDGQKYSKQNRSPALTQTAISRQLLCALSVLGQTLPDTDAHNEPEALLNWALTHWQLNRVPQDPVLITAL